MPVWRDVVQGARKVSPGSVDNASQAAKIENLDLRYDEGVQTLTFYGTVHSASRPTAYTMILTFKNVDRLEGLTEEEIQQGYMPKPSLNENEVMMRCSCPSYRFRFDEANRRHQAGTGARFGIYHRKSDREPNNPNNIPGACKHIIEFITYLQDRGFVTG